METYDRRDLVRELWAQNRYSRDLLVRGAGPRRTGRNWKTVRSLGTLAETG